MPSSASRLTAARKGQPLRVLLIEDNPGDMDLVRERLDELPGYHVEVTCSGELGAGVALLHAGKFDAMIADLTLPDATPAQTLARIEEAREQVSVLVLSGSDDEGLRTASLHAGAQEYLVKGEPATLVLGRCLLAAIEKHRIQSVQRQLERWISVTRDAVLVVDHGERVLFVNRAAQELFARSEAELLNDSAPIALDAGQDTELEIRRGQELRRCEVRVVPIDWRGEPALLATLHDTTERRRAESQLAAADRLATIGTLASTVIHEVNNPLASMVVNLELAARQVAGRPELGELRQLIQDAREAADRVRSIAADLRQLSRGAEPALEWVDVRSAVDSAIRLASHETRHCAEVVVDIAETLPAFRAHGSRIVQLLLNLIINAAQAIGQSAPERNTIRVSAREHPAHRLELSVSDTGPGMDADTLRRLFTPFFTTKPAHQGTGLGLSICQRIASSYGGRLEVESKVGAGTTFRASFPLDRGSEPPRPTAPPAPPRGRRAKVLVIDDEAMVANAVSRALKAEHDVTVAYSAMEGLVALRAGSFDVVFCDVAMPQMSGTELYELVELELPELAPKFVFLSGGAFSERSLAVLQRIPNRKLGKPLHIAALSSLIGEVLEAQERDEPRSG